MPGPGDKMNSREKKQSATVAVLQAVIDKDTTDRNGGAEKGSWCGEKRTVTPGLDLDGWHVCWL